MTLTLLAVDDSKTMRKVLEITFAGEDYRTILAENSADAVAKAKSESPRIALVDAGLGGESGYDLCQALKREAPGVSVIILSSKQAPYDKVRGASVGADDFMDKPFDTQQMIDKVAALARKAPEAMAAPPATSPYRAPAQPIAPPAPVPAAPAPAAPTAFGARPRSQTLSYGTPSPAPAMPPTPEPAAVQARAATFPGTLSTPARVSPPTAPSPLAPPVRPAAPAPHAPAPPAPAPAPIASAAVAAKTSGNGQFADQLAGLGLSKDQVDAVLSLSRDVVERVVWEVVPVLAETMIKEEIRRLTNEG